MTTKIETPPNVETQKPRSVNFYYINHAHNQGEKVARLVADEDVIFSELINMDKFERKILERQYAEVLTGKAPKLKYSTYPFSTNEEIFEKSLINALAGSGKEYYFIDAEYDSPAFHEYIRAKIIDDFIQTHLCENDPQQALNNFESYIHYFVISVQKREELVVAQMSEKIKDHRYQDRRLAVVQGAAHTNTHHLFKRKFPQLKTGFHLDKDIYRFNSYATLVRRLRFRPNAVISRIDYLRAFVCRYIMPHQEKDRQKARSILESLDENQLNHVLRRYSQAFAAIAQTYPQFQLANKDLSRAIYQKASFTVSQEYFQTDTANWYKIRL